MKEEMQPVVILTFHREQSAIVQTILVVHLDFQRSLYVLPNFLSHYFRSADDTLKRLRTNSKLVEELT